MNNDVDPARLEANWRAIAAELDAPRAGRVERILLALGVPSHVTRLVVATPALRRSWYLAIGIAVVVGLGSAQPDDRGSLFTLLVLAPTLPVLGVALAYGASADPLHETQAATPMSGVRLVALRAVTVLAVSVLAIGVPSALAPATRPAAALWLLPALALTSGSLALMTWMRPRRAAAVASLVWFATVVTARLASTSDLAAFGRVGQLAAVAVAMAGTFVVVTRRSSFDRMEVGT